MSDATPVAPPAPAAPTAAPATPAQPHHAHLQPREQGRFAGPPDTSKATTAPAQGQLPLTPTAEPPKAWRVGDREFRSPEDLAAYAAEADAERRALDAHRKQAAEAAAKVRELEALTKDPRKAITPELRRQLIQEEIERFREEEAIKAMPEEQRRLYLFAREQRQKVAEYEAKLREREEAEAEAKRKADEEAANRADAEQREELKATVTAALNAAGLEPTVFNVQRVALVMAGAAERGVVYPPEVVARKVKEKIAQERREYVTAANPASILSDLPELVERLNAIDDASLLRKLAPLGEKLRRLNLESLGAAPAATPTPVATGAQSPAARQKYPPGDPRWADELERRVKGG